MTQYDIICQKVDVVSFFYQHVALQCFFSAARARAHTRTHAHAVADPQRDARLLQRREPAACIYIYIYIYIFCRRSST